MHTHAPCSCPLSVGRCSTPPPHSGPPQRRGAGGGARRSAAAPPGACAACGPSPGGGGGGGGTLCRSGFTGLSVALAAAHVQRTFQCVCLVVAGRGRGGGAGGTWFLQCQRRRQPQRGSRVSTGDGQVHAASRARLAAHRAAYFHSPAAAARQRRRRCVDGTAVLHLVRGAWQPARLVNQREHAQRAGAALQPAGEAGWAASLDHNALPGVVPIVSKPFCMPAAAARPASTGCFQTGRRRAAAGVGGTGSFPPASSQVQAVLVVHEVDVGPGDALPRILLLLALQGRRGGTTERWMPTGTLPHCLPFRALGVRGCRDEAAELGLW
jgi:hypothetical protein